MKGLYDVRVFLIWKDKEYDLGRYFNLSYIDEAEAADFRIFKFHNINELWDKANKFPELRTDRTIFGFKPVVKMSDIHDWSKTYTINEKNFGDVITIREEYEPYTKSVSMNDLLKYLSAENFAEWWKDHAGFIECPFTKK